jgi:Zn-finger nucleic acid-binding protein
MKCPVCKDIDLIMSERQGVEIDYCPSCRGVWLDRGELDKIIDKSASFSNENSYKQNKENSFQKNNDASHGEKAEHLKESEDGLVESIVDLTEATSVQQTLKNAGIKVLIIKDDKGSIVSQHFVQSENEARKIAKEKLTAGSDGEYYDLGLDKKQTWHKPVTAK